MSPCPEMDKARTSCTGILQLQAYAALCEAQIDISSLSSCVQLGATLANELGTALGHQYWCVLV